MILGKRLSFFMVIHAFPQYIRRLALIGFSWLVLAACQPAGGGEGGMTVPSVGVMATLTHQNRITLFGGKASGTAIFLDGSQRVPRDSGTTWSTVVDLAEGLNTFVIEAMDDLGNLSDPLTVSVTLDTIPPSAPSVSFPVSTPTNPVSLSGTKEPGTFIRLNGQRISVLSDSTTWTYEATLASGSNMLRVTAVDAAGNESDPVEPVITLTTPGCAAPPRPVFPLSGRAIFWGTAFSWTQQAPVGTDVFELSGSPAFESPLVHQATLSGELRYMPIGLAPSNGVYYWRVGAVDSACGTSYGPTRTVIIGSMTGDVTGDGYADILVGADTDGRANGYAGAAYLYKGGATPDVTFDTLMTGREPEGTFGASVAKVGDIDRDGYVDFLVGAPRVNSHTGSAYLYWGGASPSPIPALTLRGETDGGLFGMSVAGVGDLNADGYPDIAVGGYQVSVTAECGGSLQRLPGVGRVYVFFGGPRDQMDDLADVVLTGETTEIPDDRSSACRSGDEFGLSVAGAGDVNGDGYDDLAVGARGYDAVSKQDVGRAYGFFGGPWFVGVGAERADIVLTGNESDDQFGAAVAGPGDTDGDGFADLMVGAHLSDVGSAIDAGSASWYFGGRNGVAPAFVQISGMVAGDSFGGSLAPAGDINGDGFADVVVGAYLVGPAPNDNGAVSYYLGNASRAETSAGTITGEPIPNPDDQFGRAVGGVGDVDGDGLDDTVVGATRHDVCVTPTRFCFDAGRAYVIPGPSVADRGVSADTRDWLLTGIKPGDRLGASVN